MILFSQYGVNMKELWFHSDINKVESIHCALTKFSIDLSLKICHSERTLPKSLSYCNTFYAGPLRQFFESQNERFSSTILKHPKRSS